MEKSAESRFSVCDEDAILRDESSDGEGGANSGDVEAVVVLVGLSSSEDDKSSLLYEVG